MHYLAFERHVAHVNVVTQIVFVTVVNGRYALWGLYRFDANDLMPIFWRRRFGDKI